MSSHKPRRPRWLATGHTMAIALHRAAKPDPANIEQILQTLTIAAKALREGVATERQWSVLAGSLDVAMAIERQGVVRGLHEHLASADSALKSIHTRAHQTGCWKPTALHYFEIDAVNAFVNLHAYQSKQLSLAEYVRALDSATGQIRSTGGRVTMTKVRDFEGAAA